MQFEGIENLDNEIWEKIWGVGEWGTSSIVQYYISNHGRVARTGRGKPRLMALHIDEDGHIECRVSKGKGLSCKPVDLRVARVVAEYFSDWFKKEACVMHKDGNKCNNYVFNLYPKGKKILSPDDENFIRSCVLGGGVGITAISRKFGITDKRIKKICGLR